MQACIEYIIRFLLGNSYTPELAKQIGYTSNKTEFHKYKLIITPSNFFEPDVYGTPKSLPALPLQTLEHVPILYGSSRIVENENYKIIDADIIASAYFLLSRYEEYIKPSQRDAHGRFQGKESIPYKAGFLHRPVVDEYGMLLKKWLREFNPGIQPETSQIQKIYLTHDIDEPFYFRSLKSTAKGLLFQNKKTVLKSYFGALENNPVYTFPWIVEQNTKLIQSLGSIKVEPIFFFKSKGKHKFDKPIYNLSSKDIQSLFRLCSENKISIGLHTSYSAGIEPFRIEEEKQHLEKIVQEKIRYNRHHFLACREVDDFAFVEKSGITDDFTMGYADVSGFRLGTCRPVHWINPATQKVSQSLTLHPLTIMDCTLDRPDYMGLSFDEAYDYCINLIKQVYKYNGEVVLLWHNTTFSDTYKFEHKKLYELLLEELAMYQT